MSQPIKNWKAGAYAALAEYYKVEAEREGFEERLEKARRNAERAGVSFRYGSPTVHNDTAYACNCGAVITYDYGATIPATHTCAECREKAATAAREDAIAEGRPDPAAPIPKPGAAPSTPPAPPTDDIPF